MEGPPERILADRTLQDAYLGQGDGGRPARGARTNSGRLSHHRKELSQDEPNRGEAS